MTVDLNYYLNEYNGKILPDDDDGLKQLNLAFRQIDTICNQKISNGTVDTYDEYIIKIVKDIICEQAEFNMENSDLINSVLSEYKIDKVTVKYNLNFQLKIVKGIALKQLCYDELSQFGLTYRGI